MHLEGICLAEELQRMFAAGCKRFVVSRVSRLIFLGCKSCVEKKDLKILWHATYAFFVARPTAPPPKKYTPPPPPSLVQAPLPGETVIFCTVDLRCKMGF